MELITVSIPQTDGYYSRSGGKCFPSLLGVFPVTPTVVTNSVENGFNDAFPGNSSTQNELKSKKWFFVYLFTSNSFGKRLRKQNEQWIAIFKVENGGSKAGFTPAWDPPIFDRENGNLREF